MTDFYPYVVSDFQTWCFNVTKTLGASWKFLLNLCLKVLTSSLKHVDWGWWGTLKGMLVACMTAADGATMTAAAVREMTALCFPLLVTDATTICTRHQTPGYLHLHVCVRAWTCTSCSHAPVYTRSILYTIYSFWISPTGSWINYFSILFYSILETKDEKLNKRRQWIAVEGGGMARPAKGKN